jgi:hypothetical protein
MPNALLSLVLVSTTTVSAELATPVVWRKLSSGPPARFAATAVHDPTRDRVILFAGETSKPGEGGKPPEFDVRHDLWEHDLAADTWQEVAIAGAGPSDRAYHAAAFDTKRARMWVFGGADRSLTPVDDLWSYDVAEKRWKKAEPSSDRPPARFSPTLHYDAQRDQLVLHGGCKGFLEPDNAFAEVWTFDLAKETWTRRAAGPGRWQAAAALAPGLDALIVEGGFDGQFTPKNEVWLYDLAKDAWRDLGKGHKATDAHAAAWDSESACFLVHGGATAAKHALEGVWPFARGRSVGRS